jgi:hypothetical protein
LGFDSREKAKQIFDLTGDLPKRELLQLPDAAYAWRGNGREGEDSTSFQHDRRRRCLGRHLRSAVLVAAVRRCVRRRPRSAQRKTDRLGINDAVIRQIGEQLEPGRAAVVMLAHGGAADGVIEEIMPLARPSSIPP